MKDLLLNFAKGEYEFKEPWRATDRSLTIVVPIIATKKVARNYVVLQEVKERVKIVDTGGISQACIEGDVNNPTFVRGGTMLKGATQERAIQFGIVVIPNRSEQIPVQCIHASRGIRPGARFQVAEMSPPQVYSTILSDRNQAHTWSEVQSFARARVSQRVESPFADRLRALVAPDDLIALVESTSDFTGKLNEILKHIPDYTDQVGVAIIDPEGIAGFEMYDHQDSWKAFSESIIRSYAEELSREDKTGIFKPDMAAAVSITRKFLDEIANAEEEEVFDKNDAKTILLKTRDHVGEYTSLARKTIHLLVARRNPRRDPVERFDLPIRRNHEATRSPIERLVNWGRRKMKKGAPVLSELKEGPRTWTDLRSDISMSKATLSSRLKELQEYDVVEKRKDKNGVVRYSLTGIGHEILQTNKPELDLASMLPPTKTRSPQQDKLNMCPKCRSKNVSISRSDKGETNCRCDVCGHGWTEKSE
jgi:DNA-binding HxlR family transcriptional regulator